MTQKAFLRNSEKKYRMMHRLGIKNSTVLLELANRKNIRATFCPRFNMEVMTYSLTYPFEDLSNISS